jgi:hypothetical protein
VKEEERQVRMLLVLLEWRVGERDKVGRKEEEINLSSRTR